MSRDINVKKRNGRLEIFNPEKINKCVERACEGLEKVSASEIVLDAQISFNDKIKTSEIDKELIYTARSKMIKHPNYSKVAARLLLNCLYKEVFKESVDCDTFEEDYKTSFIKNIKKGVKEGIYSEKLLEYDLKNLAEYLEPQRDDLYHYVGVQNLHDRYFMKLNDKIIETPQHFHMRVAMGICIEDEDKENTAKKLYDVYSQHLASASTPTLFNSGTPNNQLSSCFKGDALVSTIDGFCPIKNIKPNDLVLTQSGKYEKVIKTRSKENDKQFIKIKINNSKKNEFDLECTEDHKIFVIKKSQVSCKRNNSYTCPAAQGKKDFCYKKKNHYKKDYELLKNNLKNIKGQWLDAKDIEPGDMVQIAFSKEQKYHKINIFDYVDQSNYGISDKKVFKLKNDKRRNIVNELNKQTSPVKNKIKLNKDFGLFVGYFLAEGYHDENSLYFTFGSKEEKYIQEICKLAKKIFGLSAFVRDNGDGSTSVTIHSTILAKAFEKLTGTGFNKKILDEKIILGPKSFVEAILIGVFRGDGCSSGSSCTLSLSNKKLIHQLFGMLLRIGCLPVIQKPFMSKLAKEQPYALSLSKNDNEEFIKKINKNTDNINWEKASHEVSRSLSNRMTLDNNVFYKVTNVDKYNYEGMVYDLEVENDHTFAVENIVVHNCYLSEIDDSINGIFDGLWQEARKSKHAGGLGFHMSKIRGMNSKVKGTNGRSGGLIPWLKIYNDMLIACDQGGKRKGSGCVYVENWHIDIEEFLDLRKATGDERRRCHDLNTALWISSLFMERVQNKEKWTLFCPSETPDLPDLFGNEFNEKYKEYEYKAENGELTNVKTMDAVDLWKKMLKALFETSHPWMTFKDPSNMRYSNIHEGSVHGSNLCTEIILHTKSSKYKDNDGYGQKEEAGETAVCNLASVCLPSHMVKVDGKWKVDHNKLKETIKLCVRGLDNVININFYPTEEAYNANSRHRPVGLGSMGWADVYQRLRIAQDSEEALKFTHELMEFISYHALSASCELAKERGKYSTYEGSKWSKGLLPIDTYEEYMNWLGDKGEKINYDLKLNWDKLRERIKEHGMRNSNVMAIAPNASISYILGSEQSIEPPFRLAFRYENMSGNYFIVNKNIVEYLEEDGRWNEEIAHHMLELNGDISDSDLFDEKTKAIFKAAPEQDQAMLIKANAARQKFIDQAISFNLYNGGKQSINEKTGQPSLKFLHDIYMEAHRMGLKTTYYLRNKAASSVNKLKDIKQKEEEPMDKMELLARFNKGETLSEKELEYLNSEMSSCSLNGEEGCEMCEG